MSSVATTVVKLIAAVGFLTAAGVAILRWQGGIRRGPAFLFVLLTILLGVICSFNAIRDVTSFQVFEAYEGYAEILVFPLALFWLYAVRNLRNQQKVIRAATEREGMLLRLQRAEKVEAIGNLAGGIAHDFNNLLVPILGYGEILMDKASPGSSAHKAAEHIVTAAERAADIIKQIRSLRDTNEEQRAPVCLQVILKEVTTLLTSVLPTSITLKRAIDSDCPPVLTSVADFHRVCMNLLTNAQQAIGDLPGTIEVTLSTTKQESCDTNEPAGREVVMTVADSGAGIPPDVLARVFEPYFSTKESSGGSGLGLAVVDSAVHNAGGTISVESEVGEGTVFTLRFPAVTPELDEDTQSSEITATATTGHIMIVDDEPAVVAFIENVFANAGYHATSFADSVAALDAFQKNPDRFDVVLSDITMPRMTGDMLMQQLHEIRPSVPVILTTGYARSVDEAEVRRKGAVELLIKPVRSKRLLAVVARVVREHRTDKQAIPLQ